MIASSKGDVAVFVSQKKWLRSKEVILQIALELEEEGGLDFKELVRD